jgi:hypothetical protein
MQMNTSTNLDISVTTALLTHLYKLKYFTAKHRITQNNGSDFILGSNQSINQSINLSINQSSFSVLSDKHRFQTWLTFFTAGCSSIFWGTCPALTNPRARWRSSSVSRSKSIFAYRIMLSNTTRGIGWARALRSNSCNIKLKRQSCYSLTSAQGETWLLSNYKYKHSIP